MKIASKFLVISILTCITLNIPANGQESEGTMKSPCIPCSELKELRLPDVSITEAIEVKPDTALSSNKKVPHCKVVGHIGREINFELLLPMEWNGRFAMGGGGGFVGSIQNAVRYSLNRGYATSGTDTGHKGYGIKADWAYNNMERQVNFGHLAIHRTAEVSKTLIYYYYCSDPVYSYFLGCSRGGGQAMMEAQRYPEDFDGIVAMAPAFDWTAFAAEFIQNLQALYPDPQDLENPVVTRENLKLLQKMVLNACDEIDGIKDGILNDPRDCDFNFEDLPGCPDDRLDSTCFTKQQIEAIRTIYDGVVIDGKEVYPGFPFGGENENGGWNNWIVGPVESLKSLNYPSQQYGFGTEIFKYLIFNDPDWDYSTYDFAGFFRETEYAAAYLDATSTDYSGLKENNAKIILVHGWEDAALSALSTIDHYESVKEADPDCDQYMKLYLLPGVLHCAGGPGPSQADWLSIIRAWVEQGTIPDRVIVTRSENGKIVVSRPVYPYPRKAVYDGNGDPDKESSFK